MRCSRTKCGTEFDPPGDYSQGKHAEHTCSKCRQLLQWHYEHMDQNRSGHLVSGGPLRPCDCEKRKDDALVPFI